MLVVLDVVLEIRVPEGTDGTPCEDVAELISVVGFEANLVFAATRRTNSRRMSSITSSSGDVVSAPSSVAMPERTRRTPLIVRVRGIAGQLV
ncbi:MAG: hypothetical protein ACQET5_16025 [Halobacteriota archaeon]